ncbi:IS607 family transposase [Thermococcus bergensis]|jgi:putative resolvase|uniref:IS607 family transposase n=1 Tax=Thermococcus bergensis TaxID=2689387 RepID=UPI001CEDE349|nr:IS607 family transposase [Thermococcus bergensis]MCA6213290.1 IS607 family transposase [Thermococcus bergensis]
MERMLTPRQVAEVLGVSFITIKRWIYSGKIKAVKLPTGKWRIPESEVKKILSEKSPEETRAVIYARVSSSDQRKDLERQVEYLTSYCSAKGYKLVRIITDIASGLNAKRKGLQKLFKLVSEREVDVVLITHKDRLTRFGYEYLEYFFNQFGVRIEAIHGNEKKGAQQEFVEDLIAIVTSFAGKLYGMRSHKKKKLVQSFKQLLKEVEAE